MRKSSVREATVSEFADLAHVTPRAVQAAIARGTMPAEFVRWSVTTGGRRTARIVNLPKALEAWRARPRAPVLDTKPPVPSTAVASADPQSSDGRIGVAESRSRFEAARAKREELRFEEESGRLIPVAKAMEIYGRQIQEVKTAIMALANRARSRIPHLTSEDGIIIDGLVREILTDIAEGPPTKGARSGRRKRNR